MVDPAVYASNVEKTLDRMERAFKELAGENAPGRITVKRQGTTESLVISVKQLGDYTFSSDENTQIFSLQSPESGIHHYTYDEANKFWKSSVQIHILEEILVREFIGHSKGLLDL